MKKNDYRYLILPVVLILIYIGFNLFQNNTSSKMAIYKSGYVNDCYNDKKDANKEIVFDNKIVDKKVNLVNSSSNDLNDYQKSSCVVSTGLEYDKYFEIKDYIINHTQGTNDMTYQLSYTEVINELKSKKDKTDFDKKVISSLEFMIKDKNASQFVPTSTKEYQNNSKMIGPNQDAPSGKYVMYVKLNFVNQKVFKLDNKKKVIDNSYLVFDGVETEYVRVGE